MRGPAIRSARLAGLRYGLSAAALALVVLVGVGSWAVLDAPRRAAAGGPRHEYRPAGASKRLQEGSAPSAPSALRIPAGTDLATPAAGIVPVVSGTDAPGAKRWVRWTAAGWLLGVGVSLLRAVEGTLGAGRLRRRCRELVDPRMRAVAEQLRVKLGVSPRVRFLVSDEISVPSVLGIIYPAVLLPASLLTGVPTEQLRAIFAHELTHIRRWDYLVNLAQMVAEALLFFNPFVWWISRQMRVEREACCDLLAAGECPSPASYVEALVAVIERTRQAASPAPVLAASGPGDGNALERARRLLVPGYQPAFRIRWFSLGTMLIMCGLVLGGLSLGTRAVAQTIQAATGEKAAFKLADGISSPAPVPGVPDDVLAAARKGDTKEALKLLYGSFKPGSASEEDIARVLDDLVRAGELHAFTTLYDTLRYTTAKDWKPGDELLAGLAKDGRTDFSTRCWLAASTRND